MADVNDNTNQQQQLIALCRKGNSQAQFQLYKLYYKAMYNTCLRIVNNQTEAEDLMQESFLTAFEQLHQFRGEVSFGAWLKRIVVNKSLDYLRRNRLNIMPVDDIAEPADIAEPEPQTHADIQAEILKKALLLMPEGYRIVFSLYLIEGYDHDEIAQILNISASASRSQLTRAKQKMAHILTQNFNIKFV